MNNIQSNSTVSIKTNTNAIPQHQKIEINDQSPDHLKQKIESGEINENDFPSREDFEKFIAFLTKMLGEEIKPATRIDIASKSETIEKKEVPVVKVNENDKANTAKTIETNPQQVKARDKEMLKEGVNTVLVKQTANQSSQLANVSQPQQSTEMDLFKADKMEKTEKSTIIKEQSIQINDKTVVLHTVGGNNLSINSSEVSAEGDATFLEQSRTFAEDEGFQERQGQQQSENDESDIDKIYFTKDSEQ